MKREALSIVASLAVLMLVGCSGGGGDDQPKGEFRVDLSGGSAEMIGGSGGGLFIQAEGVSVESTRASQHVNVPDASFDPDFGEHKVTITGQVEVPLIERDEDEPAEGGLYLLKDETDLYISDGDHDLDTHIVATGLEVATGAKLILSVNDTDIEDQFESRWVDIYFDKDVVIGGTVTVKGSENVHPIEDDDGNVIDHFTRYERGSLYLRCFNLLLAEEGSIDLKGLDTAEAVPDTNVDAISPAGGLLRVRGVSTDRSRVVIEGTIDVSGGSDTQDSDKQGGGFAGEVNILASKLFVDKSAIIDARGMSGRDWGGLGGVIDLLFTSECYNLGTISLNGGNAQMGADDAQGGSGGKITFSGRGEGLTFVQLGKIEAFGGDANGSDSFGGSGGGVLVYLSDSSADANPVIISGALDLHGGSATSLGGRGGLLVVSAYYMTANPERKVLLSGYRAFDLSGSDGTLQGGTGGKVSVKIENGSNDFLNESDIIANGGDAVNSDSPYRQGEGGDGGSITMNLPGVAHGENSGNIYLNGGKSYGAADNSDGGSIEVCINDPADFTISGSVYQSAGSGGTGEAGNDGEIVINNCN